METKRRHAARWRLRRDSKKKLCGSRRKDESHKFGLFYVLDTKQIFGVKSCTAIVDGHKRRGLPGGKPLDHETGIGWVRLILGQYADARSTRASSCTRSS